MEEKNIEKDHRFDNYAFISYSHQNKPWARWVQRKLESYNISSTIRKKLPHVPKTLRPVFLDTTDIGTGLLRENLYNELKESNYLIVICSPSAAKSEWVNNEIGDFVSLGRSRHIIPLIIEGTPYSDTPDQECYPAALRSISGDILGIDVREMGRSRALFKIIAALLGLKFDYLWQRHKKAIHKKMACAITMVTVFLLALSSYIYAYQLPNVRYYKGYIRVNGIFQGFYPVSRQDTKKRMSTWKITRKGRLGKPFQVDVVDGAGNPSKVDRVNAIVSNLQKDNTIWATRIKIKYNQDGKILEELVVDDSDNVFLDFLYIKDDLAAYVENGFVTPQSMAGASYVKIVHDKNGMETETYFFDQRQAPIEDNTGAYGIKMSYKPDMSEIKITSVDKDGNPILNKNGFVSYRMVYDGAGNVSRTEYLGFRDELIETDWKYSVVKADYDRYGNVEKYTFQDKDGNAVQDSNGIKEIQYHCENGIFKGVKIIK